MERQISRKPRQILSFMLGDFGWCSILEVMTMAEGRVPRSKSAEFKAAFAQMKGKPTPPGLKMSLLLRDTKEPELYRLSTLWESREVLDSYRSSTDVPVAIRLFRSVGVEPQISIFEISERLP